MHLRHLLTWIATVMSLLQVEAQNLVPNGDFEQYTQPPTYWGQCEKALGWSKIAPGPLGYPVSSPDYYYWSSFINTQLGWMYAYSGNGQMGLVFYGYWEGGEFHEYISTKLDSALYPPRQYELSFFITNGMDGQCGAGSNHVGVHFSYNPLYQDTCEVINVTPQIEIDSVIYHYGYWQKYSFIYSPSDTVRYMSIGNFYSYANTSFYLYAPVDTVAYYFFDKIELVPHIVLVSVVEMPDVFTPNGDGVNDQFTPVKLVHVADPVLTIYSRWGNELASISDTVIAWDGTTGGADCPEGNYFWVLSYLDADSQPATKGGMMSLFR